MKKTAIFYFLGVFTLFLLSLAGCGGNESYISSSSSSATVPFSGVVEDGPIADAKVSLRDNDGTFYPLYDSQNHTNYEIKTDVSGTFSLKVKAGLDPSALSVVAVGGVDSATGMDFHNIEMRCPYELFQGVVSPVTTLVDALNTQGFTHAAAETRVREWLALPDNINLTSSPATSLDLQRRTLLLTKIALEMKATQPFQAISLKIATLGTSLLTGDGTCDSSILSSLGLNDFEVERVSQLHELLEQLNPEINTPEDAFSIFKNEEINYLFDDNFSERLELSPPFAENYQKNIKVLTEKTLLAAGDEVFLLVDPIPKRLFRYIFSTYMESDPTSSDSLKKLSPQEKLLLDSLTFATILTSGNIALENDPWIALLARSRAPNSVETPLLWNELPGNDNQKRLASFYGSDRSPHFYAEQLLARIFDDAISDKVFLKIVEAKASAGLTEETLTIITTQMVQLETKGHASLSLANALIKYNRLEEARSALDLARDFYRQVILSKGVASASSADVVNLLATSTAYRQAGDLLNAEILLDVDVAGIAAVLVGDAIYYGKLISGIKNMVDTYIAAGDLIAAAPLVEKMIYYSGLTPAYLGTYRLRVYNWIESAKRCADLGESELLLQVYYKVEALRSADSVTSTATWVYVPALIESLYRVGAPQEAMDLAKTIPSTSLYRAPAFKLSAPYEALQGQLETAFSIVDEYFPKVEEQLELLTYYFVVKQKKTGIALALITAGRFSEARLSLEKAEDLLAGMQGTNLTKIRYGYVKLAELYVLIGDSIHAETLMHDAQKLIIDDVYSVPVLVDIALGYHNLNQTNVAKTILAEARSLADANPTWYRTDVLPNLSLPEAATLLYETFVSAYEKIGEKGLVHTTTLNFLLPWAQQIHTAGTVNDTLAAKECEYLLRGALYLERSGDHAGALDALATAQESASQLDCPDRGVPAPS